jgi:hypothetical protein
MTNITKAQLKALKIASGHIRAGNAPAFIRSIEGMIRAASSKKQAEALKTLSDAMLRGEAI